MFPAIDDGPPDLILNTWNLGTFEPLNGSIRLLDYSVRPCQHVRRNRNADLLGRLEINHELELGRLLDGQVRGLSPFENLIYEVRRAPHRIMTAGGIGNEATILDERSSSTHGWKPVLRGKLEELSSMGKVEAIVSDDKRFDALLDDRAKGVLKPARVFYVLGLNPHSQRLRRSSRLSQFILISLIPFVRKDSYAGELGKGFFEKL